MGDDCSLFSGIFDVGLPCCNSATCDCSAHTVMSVQEGTHIKCRARLVISADLLTMSEPIHSSGQLLAAKCFESTYYFA